MPYADPLKQREYQRQWMARKRERFLEGVLCAWCGSGGELHVHHRDPTQKVSHRFWGWKDERIHEELAKCDIICRSCHEQHHADERRQPCGNAAAYFRGCRCDLCKAANTAYRRGLRERKASA